MDDNTVGVAGSNPSGEDVHHRDAEAQSKQTTLEQIIDNIEAFAIAYNCVGLHKLSSRLMLWVGYLRIYSKRDEKRFECIGSRNRELMSELNRVDKENRDLNLKFNNMVSFLQQEFQQFKREQRGYFIDTGLLYAIENHFQRTEELLSASQRLCGETPESDNG